MERDSGTVTVLPVSPRVPLLFFLHPGIDHLNAHKFFLLIIFLSSPLLLPRSLAAETTFFDYSDFKNFSGICLQGNASVEGTGAIQLTDRDMHKSVGLAYYCHPIHLWNATTRELANFTTTFTFGVSKITSSLLGGGVTFFLSDDPTIPPDGRGDYLGLVNSLTVSEGRRFVAVEFDSWHNEWDPLNSSCHVGIDINSIESVEFAKMHPNSFRAGPQGKAQVAYSSVSKNLSVSLGYNYTIYELSYIVDLRSELPERVYVGFSLAIDYSYDPKNISSWSFRYSNLDAPQEPQSPPPVAPSEFVSTNNTNGRSTKKKIGLLVAAIAIPLWVIFVIAIACFIVFKSRTARERDRNVGENNAAPHNEGEINFPTASSRAEECQVVDPRLHLPQINRTDPVDDDFEDAGLHHIPFKDLVAATDNFHESRRLDSSASGGVYRGFLRDLKREAAIKRIKEYSKEGKKEFIAEMKTISRIRHRNLVELIGCCREGRELLLVYDFMPNRSLDYHLFDHDSKVLTWQRRHNIAIGLASALQYLHDGLDKCIVHRDVKPSNIMLDGNFTAKLGDFGLARIAEHGSSLQWTLNAGTVGYMAPERVISGIASKETDVYSFGIVALELASGRRAVEPREKGKETLIHWMWELYGKDALMDAIDKKLETTFDRSDAEQLMMVGLWCAHPEAPSRPSFRQVISALNFEIAVPDLNMNPSSMAQLPYTLVSGTSSSTRPTDDWRSPNDWK